MTEPSVCDHCGEELPKEPIRLGDHVYCCQACAFEASRSQDCGGRTDIHSSDSIPDRKEFLKQ